MSVDKLVDSTQLDSDLTSVADAIRTKGGTSSSLSFPDGFVSAVGNIPTGGGSTLITKSITENGTYNASSDNADGFSSVTVAVPLASRLVSGKFTGASSEAGQVKNISISYSGSGFPISLLIYPTAGSHKSGTDIYTSTQRYAIVMLALTKADTGSAPDYTDNIEKNQALVIVYYKNSTTDSTVHSTAAGNNIRAYYNSNATTPHTSTARFKDATTLSVLIAGTSYGFLAETEYTYEIIYSS